MDKLKTNYRDLNPAETRDQLETHIAAMNANPNYASPVPDAMAIGTTLSRVQNAITAFAAADAAWEAAKSELDDAVKEGQGILNQRANNCNSVTPGDRTKLATTGLPLIDATPNTTAPTPQIMNLSLAGGDMAGMVDPNWDSAGKRVRTYEVQSTLTFTGDPNTATWTSHPACTKSSTTIGPFTSGARIWVRVRGVGTGGPGPWSDPATIIVP